MKLTRFTQLTLDFSVLKNRPKDRITGYDCYGFIDLTGTVGVVDFSCCKSGDYLVYLKGKAGLVPNNPLILPYKRNQLEVVPGRGRCSWDKFLERERRKKRSRRKEK